MAEITPPWAVVALLHVDAPALDWPAIRAEWLDACRQLVERAIREQESTYAAQSRAGEAYRCSHKATEVDMRWAAARARDPVAQLAWTPAVAEAQREQAEALAQIIRQRLEVARG